MKREAATRILAERLPREALVLAALGSTAKSWKAADPLQPTYNTSDPMGISSSVALGLALARPDDQVIHLVGDGDLLMGLSVLVAIAEAAPANLRTFVFHNRRYETGGARPLVASSLSDLNAIALGAGLPWAERVEDEDALASRLDALFDAPGPGLLDLNIDPEPSPYPGVESPWSQAESRTFFMQRIGTARRPSTKDRSKS